jgi:hypothetical protein
MAFKPRVSPELQRTVFMQPQFIIDAVKYVIRESSADNVNDEIREMDACIRRRSADGGAALDRFLGCGEGHGSGVLPRQLLTRHLWRNFEAPDQQVLLQLMKAFKLTERQAEDILELRLRQLARLEGIKIEQELAELRKDEANLHKLLGSEPALRKVAALLRPSWPPLVPHGGSKMRSSITLTVLFSKARYFNSTPKPPRKRPGPPLSGRKRWYSSKNG